MKCQDICGYRSKMRCLLSFTIATSHYFVWHRAFIISLQCVFQKCIFMWDVNVIFRLHTPLILSLSAPLPLNPGSLSHSECSSPSLITPPQSPLNLETSSFASSQSQGSISTLPRISVSPVPIGERRKDRYDGNTLLDTNFKKQCTRILIVHAQLNGLHYWDAADCRKWAFWHIFLNNFQLIYIGKLEVIYHSWPVQNINDCYLGLVDRLAFAIGLEYWDNGSINGVDVGWWIVWFIKDHFTRRVRYGLCLP